MSAERPTHHGTQHRTGRRGIEAVTLVSDRSFPRHAHDTFGIGVLAFGAHRSWSGIGAVEAVAGDIITVNPGELHDGMPIAGAARGWRMLYFDPAVVTGAMPEQSRGTAEFTRPVLRDAALAPVIAQLFARMTAATPDPLADDQVLLHALQGLLRRRAEPDLDEAGPAPPVQRAVARLDQDPATPVSLDELAAIVGVGRFQLLRGFRRATGTTPHAYQVQARVRLARDLMAMGCTPAAAAVDAGFADQSHLTRSFRRQFGVTPARFRAALP